MDLAARQFIVRARIMSAFLLLALAICLTGGCATAQAPEPRASQGAGPYIGCGEAQYEYVVGFVEENLYPLLQERAAAVGDDYKLIPGSTYSLGACVPRYTLKGGEIRNIYAGDLFPVFQNEELIAWVYASSEEDRNNPSVVFSCSIIRAASETEAACVAEGNAYAMVDVGEDIAVEMYGEKYEVSSRSWMLNDKGDWYPEPWPEISFVELDEYLHEAGYDLSPAGSEPPGLSKGVMDSFVLSEPGVRIPLDNAQEREIKRQTWGEAMQTAPPAFNPGNHGWQEFDGYWCYVNQYAQLAEGWAEVDGETYYFRRSEDNIAPGPRYAMLADGEWEIDGELYEFDESGHCLNPR